MKPEVKLINFLLIVLLTISLASCGKVPSDEGEGGTNLRASRLDDIAMTTTEPYSFYAGDSLADKNQTNMIRGVFSYEEAELAYRKMSENCNMNMPFVAFDYEDDEVFPIFWFFGKYKEGTTEEDIKSKPFYELEYSSWYTMTGLYYKDVYTQREDPYNFVDGDIRSQYKHFVAKAEFCWGMPDSEKQKTPLLCAEDIFLRIPDGNEENPAAYGYSNTILFLYYDHEFKDIIDGPVNRPFQYVDSAEPFTEEYFNKIKHTFKMIVLPYEKH